MNRRCVILESPYHADTAAGIEANLEYARCAVRDSLLRGEAPFASHLIYTQVFDDNIQTERTMGIGAGIAWGKAADATVVFQDRGISPGMRMGIDDAVAAGRPVEYRNLNMDSPRVAPTSEPMVIAARRQLAEIKVQRKDAGVSAGGFTGRLRGL